MSLLYLLQSLSTIVLVFMWVGAQAALYGYWFFNLRTSKNRLAKAAGAGGVLVSFISAGVDPRGDFQSMYDKDPSLTTVVASVYAVFMTIVIIVILVNIIRYAHERIALRHQSGDSA